jgi:DNA-binding CsgD family transcriptional regulator
MLFLGGHERPASSPGRVIGRLYGLLYGLTTAETRLVEAVLRGDRLGDYAEAAGITINTVKTQMKQIFAKTGLNRQADLVRHALADPMIRLASSTP